MPPFTSSCAPPSPDIWSLRGTEFSLREVLASVPADERRPVLLRAAAAGAALDLAGADLRGLDLGSGALRQMPASRDRQIAPKRIDLSGANLSGALLSGSDLVGVVLRSARLDGAILVGADLRGADLSGASLRGANLSGATIRRADLSFADLRGASLLTADLSQATATGVDCRETLLQSAVLDGACLRDADMRWAHLDGARLSGADLDGARFEGAVLTLASLAGARLTLATELSYSFLHHARLERTALARHHVRHGIGEAFTDLAAARETYQQLGLHFAGMSRYDDARWARWRAWSMATETHRPDRAARYHAQGQVPMSRIPPDPAATGESGGVAPRAHVVVPGARAPTMQRDRRERRHLSGGVRAATGATSHVLFLAVHTTRWMVGHVAEWVTGYGTSVRRVTIALLAVWLVFAALFRWSGAVIDLGGAPVGWPGVLGFSAAALTPIDAYPLAATSDVARLAAVAEGMLGIALLGTLGFVAASRFRPS